MSKFLLLFWLLISAFTCALAQTWDDFVAARLSEYLGRPISAAEIGSGYSLLFEDGACAAFLNDGSVWSLNNAVIDVWGYYGNTYRLYTHDYNEGGAFCAGETLDEPNPLPPIEPEPPDECEAVHVALQLFGDAILIRIDLMDCLG